MKLQFKHQKFQADAAKAVVDVFAGQPYLTPTYMMDRGTGIFQIGMNEEDDFTGWRNQPLVPELSKRMILEQIQEIQRIYQITPSQKLEGEGYNLTIEMETGVGKTYTYIKTMFELNKHYGWSKFIVVVPSIAIREGVYKSFEVTQEHFAEEYGKKIRFFIYNSAQLTEIDRFASDNSINVMIINSQAFNARGKDARRIYMKLDEFRSRRPIDIIAKTNPVLIIDEPQSVEGKQTKERLREFHPLLTLRYSATHKSDSIYNMIYRLDAMEAYNKRLVKKIAVKGIAESGSTATESYVYLQSINLSKADPTATIQFDYKGTSGIRKVTKTVSIGFNLYDQSNGMEEYHNNFVVKSIDGRDDSVEFLNGIKIYAGDVIGKVSEEQLRRIQIRETILSHIERERQLYYKGIKVLSLFFIDEVAHYKQYDETGESKNGIFADMFEEEYRDIVENLQMGIGEEAYFHYLNSISAESTHAGYFSIDKKGKMVNSKVGRRETTTDDVDAYDLIMKNKELLLDRDPKRSPVRFIFSHSALREGWDNPNVFQICTLKQSGSDVRKRQEVGRGLRLCVNQDGERQDANVLGNDVHNINILTVIAKGFDLAEGATGLQKGDYLFLQRFLDSTKANLFFAKGIIMVEGDAENILIPVIADIIGYPLEKYGVSIVNVGSTAFLRYSGILIRKNGEKIGIPVSVITDCDVRPYDIDEKTKEKQFNEKVSESLQAEQAKNEKYSNGSVRGFTSPRWTLEYCIAMSCLSEDFHKAVHYGKKILNAQENIAITDSKIDEANGLVKEEAKQWDSLPLSKRAYNIFSLMLNADGKSGLKAIVAQCLASILRWKVSVIPEKLTQEKMFDVELYGLKTDEKKKVELSNKIENDSFLGYIVRAIKYASGIEE